MITVLAAPGAALAGARIELEPDEAHHLRVRRASAGDPVRVLDGTGVVGEGRLETGGATWWVRLEEVRRVEPPIPLRLLVGAGDRERFGWLAEKCAEIGVTELIPVETERARAVANRVRPATIERLGRRAREATKQSGAAWAPAVADPCGMDEAIGRAGDGTRWLADAAGEPVSGAPAAPVAVAVGPEGGFTPEERARLVRAGFIPVRFGPHVMRFETAALAAAILARSATPGRVHE